MQQEVKDLVTHLRYLGRGLVHSLAETDHMTLNRGSFLGPLFALVS